MNTAIKDLPSFINTINSDLADYNFAICVRNLRSGWTAWFDASVESCQKDVRAWLGDNDFEISDYSGHLLAL